MRNDSKFSLQQYVTGRSDTDKGYNFRKSSDGTPVYPWMNGKTRACTISDEMPTIEVKAQMKDDGRSDLILVESRHVTARYHAEGDQIIREKCRPYDYSRYLVIPSGMGDLDEQDRPEAALKVLAAEDYSMDVLEYQHISEDDNLILETIPTEGRKLQANWQEMERSAGMNAALSKQNLGVFLARYWESCWNVVCEKEPLPLIVVATSPGRNSEQEGYAVIPDGLLFFNKQVIPNLPEAVKNLLCVSFGCLAVQTDAQPGTACRVCYPDADAIQSNCVYRVYHDQVRDDNVMPVHVDLGKMMLEGKMPSAYCNLKSLQGSRIMQEDFDYIYNVVDFEMLLKELSVDDLDSEMRENMLKDAIQGFTQLKQMLADREFNPNEISFVLYDLEIKYTKALNEYFNTYDPALYRDWINEFEQIKEREKLLEEDDKLQKLTDNWHSILIKPFDKNITWTENPLMELAQISVTEARAKLLTDILNNGQTYPSELESKNKQEVDTLLTYEQELRKQNRDDAATALLEFLMNHCGNKEDLLSANRYLTILSGTERASSEAVEKMKGDVRTLLERHCRIRKDNPMYDPAEAVEELNRRERDWQTAFNSELRLNESQMTALCPEDEKLVPDWYREGRQAFSEELYERLLDQAISLKNRSGELKPPVLQELNDIYFDSLTGYYPGESPDQCPLAITVRKSWKDSGEWETALLKKTEQKEATICEPEQAVGRLVQLRRAEQKEAGDLWLERIMGSYDEQEEILSLFINHTMDIQGIKGSIEEQIQKDMISLLKGMPINTDTIRNLDLRQISEWYQARGGYRNEELTEQINKRFLAEFKERKEQNQEKTTLAEIYTNVFKPKTVDPEIKMVMLSQFDDMSLIEICNGGDALTAIGSFFKTDSALIQSFKEQMKNRIEQSDDLQIRDLPLLVQVEKYTGPSSMGDHICQVLEKTYDDFIPENVMNSLAEYVKEQPRNQKSLIDAFEHRCENAPNEEFQSRFAEMLVFLRLSEIPDDLQARRIEKQTKEIQRKIEERELNKTLLIELVPAVGKAKHFQPNIQAEILSFYDTAESPNQYSQMDEFAESLQISVQDIIRHGNTPWMIYMFRKEGERYCADIKKEDITLDKILEKVESSAGSLEDLEQLKQKIEKIPEAQDTIKGVEKHLSDTYAEIIRQDASLGDTGTLSNIIRRLNGIKGEKFGVDLLSKEAYQYISKLLRDENRFNELACDPASIRDLKQCMEALHQIRNVKIDEDLQEKEKALEDACRVFEFYDERAAKTGPEIHDLIKKIRTNGWRFVSDVCYRYGSERMADKDTNQRIIPVLLNNLEKNDESLRFQWNVFLNQIFPLAQKGGWDNADIWGTKENAYGELAYVMNWLGQTGMEEEYESFITWLNRSNIARKARSGKHVKELNSHYDERMDNRMISWILQKSGSQEKKAKKEGRK